MSRRIEWRLSWENQARRTESYPDLRSRILAHLEETRQQAEMIELCIERQENLEIAAYRSLIGAAEEFRRPRDRSRLQGDLAPGGGDTWLERHLPEVTRQYLRRQQAGETAKR